MRNYIILSFLLSLLFNTARADENAYHIKFKITGVKDTTCQLAYHYGKNKLLKDSAQIVKGEFSFKGSEKLDQGIYLVVMPGQNYFEFIVNDDQEFTMISDSKDYVENMEVKGNEENTYFYDYLRFVSPRGKERYDIIEEYKKVVETDSLKAEELKAKAIAINEEIDTYRKKYVEEHKGMLSASLLTAMEEPVVPPMDDIADLDKRKQARYNYYCRHYFDNIDLSDDRMLRTPVFYGRLENYLSNIIVQTPDSLTKAADFLMASTGDNEVMFRYMLNYITQAYSPKKDKAQIMCLDEIPYHMYKNYFLKDARVDWISDSTRTLIEEEVLKTQYNLCGDIAQELTCKDTLGITRPLSQVKSKYTILYFYSATCGHCKKATPKLQEMYDSVGTELDLEVYSVCIDESDREYKKFINKYHFSWLNLQPSEEDIKYGFRTKYNVFSTPTIYVLNKKKEIIGKKLGVEDIEGFIRQYDKHNP